MFASNGAGVDQSQLDNTVPDVLEMYNWTEQQNASPSSSHYRGKKGKTGGGVGGRREEKKQLLNPPVS